MANMRTDDSLFRILGRGMEERSEIDLGNCHRYSLYRQVDTNWVFNFCFLRFLTNRYELVMKD